MKVKPVRWRRGIVALALLTPVLTAGIAIASIGELPSDSQTGQPNLQAALVNNDQLVTENLGGTKVPVAAGRLLVGQLVTSSDSGFDWTITDGKTAADGLASGLYAAVVTIPQNFSASYISSTTPTPTQATLDVQTDGSHSYLAAVLARALTLNIQQSLSTQLTQGFIDNLLMGYSTIGTGLAAAEQGAVALSSGLGELSRVTAALPGATSELATGAQGVDSGIRFLGQSLWSLGAFSQNAVTGSVEVVGGLADMQTLVDSMSNTDPLKASMNAKLAQLKTQAATLAANTFESDLGIDVGAAATDLLSGGSALVAQGSKALAGGMPLLNDGVSAAASGSTSLASGLDEITQALPSYTEDQATQLSDVISTPIVTTLTTNPSLPRASGAVAAFAIPISLWLGALMLSLVYVPFEQRALRSRAGTTRIVWGATLPTLGMALIQALLVIGGALLAGIQPVHHIGLFILVIISSISFVLLHQGLAALTGRFAWLVSIALLSLQIVASGVILPTSYLPETVQTLGGILPLSQAIRGSQELITGGSITSASASVAWLIGAGLVGLLLTTIAVAKERNIRTPALNNFA